MLSSSASYCCITKCPRIWWLKTSAYYSLTIVYIEQGLARTAHFCSAWHQHEMLMQLGSCKNDLTWFRCLGPQFPLRAWLLNFPAGGLFMWLAWTSPQHVGLQGSWISYMVADFSQNTNVEAARLSPWEWFPVAFDSVFWVTFLFF